MEKLRIGIIGLGFVGMLHIDAIRRLPGAEIVAVADANIALAKEVAGQLGIPKYYTDIDGLLQSGDIDVIHNCTPNVLHKEINIKVIERGIHLYSEKPLARNTEEAAAIMESLSRHPEVVAGVNHCYRMNPMVQEAHEMVQSGVIGNVWLAHGRYLQDFLTEETDYSWRIDPEVSGPSRCIADIGTHVMDTIQFVLGEKITDVCSDLLIAMPFRKKPKGEVASFSKNENQEYEEIKVKTEDYGAVLFKTESGAHGVFYVSEISQGHGCGLTFEIDGSQASVSWNQEHPNQLEVGYRDQGVLIRDRDPNMLTARAKGYTGLAKGHPEGWNDAEKNAIGKYYEYVISGDKDFGKSCEFATFDEAFYLLKLVEAILKSNAVGGWVHVNQWE